MTNYSEFDASRVDWRGFSIYDPASAYHWVPTIERSFLSLKERAKRLNFPSVFAMAQYAERHGFVLYEKPKIEKKEKMTFPTDIINSQGKGKYVCKQCSSCHSCR